MCCFKRTLRCFQCSIENTLPNTGQSRHVAKVGMLDHTGWGYSTNNNTANIIKEKVKTSMVKCPPKKNRLSLFMELIHYFSNAFEKANGPLPIAVDYNQLRPMTSRNNWSAAIYTPYGERDLVHAMHNAFLRRSGLEPAVSTSDHMQMQSAWPQHDLTAFIPSNQEMKSVMWKYTSIQNEWKCISFKNI